MQQREERPAGNGPGFHGAKLLARSTPPSYSAVMDRATGDGGGAQKVYVRSQPKKSPASAPCACVERDPEMSDVACVLGGSVQSTMEYYVSCWQTIAPAIKLKYYARRLFLHLCTMRASERADTPLSNRSANARQDNGQASASCSLQMHHNLHKRLSCLGNPANPALLPS
jgi:hypothetical protein